MWLRMVGSLSVIFLLPLLAVAGQNPADDSIIHGTINIALGNENGLVVLTDSMITAGTQQLSEPGQKLFKLDDRTVCSIAGFVSAQAASARAAVPDLNVSTSAIIHEYIRQSVRQAPQSIAERLHTLSVIFRINLSAIANVRDALGNATGTDGYRFQVIVAGYDTDDKLKIGRITFRTDNTSLSSDVEDASISDVQQQLMWRLNGMPDVAIQILQHPEAGPKDPAIDLYATSLHENGGRSLTVDQMVQLAKRLAYYTSKAHPEVGGPNQVAVFKKSQIVSIDQPTFPEPPRPLFRFSLVVNSHFTYSSVVFGKGNTSVFVRCSWTGMQHELDGHYYIGSRFTNSVLIYDGGDVNIGDTNLVADSMLLLGPHAIFENEVVRRLTTTFPSLRVAYARPKPWQVVPDSSQ
jgi:20S proteasome alpha/beta subunit